MSQVKQNWHKREKETNLETQPMQKMGGIKNPSRGGEGKELGYQKNDKETVVPGKR